MDQKEASVNTDWIRTVQDREQWLAGCCKHDSGNHIYLVRSHFSSSFLRGVVMHGIRQK